jgi:hypothetical protein
MNQMNHHQLATTWGITYIIKRSTTSMLIMPCPPTLCMHRRTIRGNPKARRNILPKTKGNILLRGKVHSDEARRFGRNHNVWCVWRKVQLHQQPSRLVSDHSCTALLFEEASKGIVSLFLLWSLLRLVDVVAAIRDDYVLFLDYPVVNSSGWSQVAVGGRVPNWVRRNIESVESINPSCY